MTLFLNEPEFICLLSFRWFQILLTLKILFNIILFFCTHLNHFKVTKWLNSLIWLTDGALTGTITPSLSGPESMATKEYSTLPKAPRPELYHQIQFSVISRTLVGWSYFSAKMQWVYSIAIANWGNTFLPSRNKNLHIVCLRVFWKWYLLFYLVVTKCQK